MPPAALNGYSPKYPARKSMISGWRANAAAATSPGDGGRSACVATIQSLSLPGLPAGGPETVQPSSGSPSSSNEVLPSPVDTTMSSRATPGAWTVSSLA